MVRIKKCYYKDCGKSVNSIPKPVFFAFPQRSNSFLCADHFPKSLFGKKKLKQSAFNKVQQILEEENIIIPKTKIAEKKRNVIVSRKCVFQHCNTIKTQKPRFFKFPDSKSPLFKEWLEKCNMRNENLPIYNYVCEKHFDSYSFNKKKKIKNAVPNRNLSVSSNLLQINNSIDTDVYEFCEETLSSSNETTLMNSSNYKISTTCDNTITEEISELCVGER